MKKLNILFVASEVAPFAKSGGLADVAGALPKAIHELGHDIRVVMPRYYGIDRSTLVKLDCILGVPMGTMGDLYAGVYEGYLPNSSVKIYFIDYEEFFGRSGLYDQSGYSYADNDKRFIFFSRSAMQLAKQLHFHPDILHLNDWHSASMAIMLNTIYAYDSTFAHTGSLLSIHNLEHQGRFSKEAMDLLAVGWEHFNANELEEFDGINLLKSAIVHSDIITTVSPKYAYEITTSEFGCGLEALISHYNHKLYGILNGVDYDIWSPSIDSYIAKKFDVDALEDKAICKRDLQKSFNLPQRDDVPLIGLVGRLVKQKGIELVASSIHRILELEVQIVLLGAGDIFMENFFSQVAASHNHKFACYIGYREDLAHKIEAGSDLFLMPSLFEPCGLNQIYSLRYGTLPIVRGVGGLDDTVSNYQNDSKSGSGFKFYDATSDALFNTVGWAVYTWYNDKDGFVAMQKNGMKRRFSWQKSAKEYEALYYKIYKSRRGL